MDDPKAIRPFFLWRPFMYPMSEKQRADYEASIARTLALLAGLDDAPEPDAERREPTP